MIPPIVPPTIKIFVDFWNTILISVFDAKNYLYISCTKHLDFMLREIVDVDADAMNLAGIGFVG